MVQCPRCEQGVIKKVRVTRFSVTIAKCAECDAVWPVGGPVMRETFVQFQLFLELLEENEMDTPYEELGRL